MHNYAVKAYVLVYIKVCIITLTYVSGVSRGVGPVAQTNFITRGTAKVVPVFIVSRYAVFGAVRPVGVICALHSKAQCNFAVCKLASVCLSVCKVWTNKN